MMVPREMAKRTHHEKVHSNLLPSCQDSAVFRFPFSGSEGSAFLSLCTPSSNPSGMMN